MVSFPHPTMKLEILPPNSPGSNPKPGENSPGETQLQNFGELYRLTQKDAEK